MRGDTDTCKPYSMREGLEEGTIQEKILPHLERVREGFAAVSKYRPPAMTLLEVGVKGGLPTLVDHAQYERPPFLHPSHRNLAPPDRKPRS